MNLRIKRLTLASMLVALSIVLDLIVKLIITAQDFSIPLYALPLIIGGAILGPIYGMVMGLIQDIVSFFILPSGTFNILFSVSAMMWGLFSGLLLRGKRHFTFVLGTVFISHVFVTTTNTIALWILFSRGAALNLILRAGMIPVNIIVLTILYQVLQDRLEDLAKGYLTNGS